MKFSLVLLVLISITGCNQDNEALEDKARVEGRVSAGTQIQAENDNLVRRAREMEVDLSRRHRFYQAVKGTYEGVLATAQGEFRVRFTIFPSLSPYAAERTRTLEEISADLSNLYLNIQVVQWNPASQMSAVGCRVEAVRPDLIHGEINIASENCSNLYSLRVGDGSARDLNDAVNDATVSSDVASEVLSGNITSVAQIIGSIQPTTNSSVYRFSAARVLPRGTAR